jgi:hypothetical protein
MTPQAPKPDPIKYLDDLQMENSLLRIQLEIMCDREAKRCDREAKRKRGGHPRIAWFAAIAWTIAVIEALVILRNL